MLRITEQRGTNRVVVKLEGRLSAAWVIELDRFWRVLATTWEGDIWVDLEDVLLVDAAGRDQLARMHRAGARFLASGCVMPELVREIAEADEAQRGACA